MNKTKKHRLFRFGALIALVILVSAAGLVAWYQLAKSSSRQIAATRNKPLIEITKNIEGELLAITSGRQCERDGNANKCYQMQTAIFLADYPPDKNYTRLVSNLNLGNWTRDGEKITPLSQEQIEKFNTVVSQEPDSPQSASLWSIALLTPTFFGERDFLKKNNYVASVFVTPDDQRVSDGDFLYALRAEIPAEETFDFNSKVFMPLKKSTNKIILAISASK